MQTDTFVMDETIISAFGIPRGKNYVSIKGDPGLRETASSRNRHKSSIDKHAGEVLEACEWLLKKSGCYSVYIGFNNGEVRTESVFNPFNYEIHDAEVLIRDGYKEQHFPAIPFREKTRIIRRVQDQVQTSRLREYLPEHWRALLDDYRHNWSPVDKKMIKPIISAFRRLREIESFYLRYAAISLSQNIVRASFNCDGTYLVQPEYFPKFVDDIAP